MQAPGIGPQAFYNPATFQYSGLIPMSQTINNPSPPQQHSQRRSSFRISQTPNFGVQAPQMGGGSISNFFKEEHMPICHPCPMPMKATFVCLMHPKCNNGQTYYCGGCIDFHPH